jgi:zinc protease
MSLTLPRPEVSPASPWLFPQPRQFRLGNGAQVWLYDLPSQHVVSCQVVLDVPVNCEPAEREGVATIALNTSDEGSTNHPGAELAERIDDLGASYSGAAGQGSTVCRMEVASNRLIPALDLMAEIITRPAYAEADVARHVALRLAQIEQSMARSSALVQLAAQRAIYDPAQRIGRPTAGQAACVEAITHDDVVGFHDHWWRPQGATIILAGALPDDIEQHLSEAFACWTPNDSSPVHELTRANPNGKAVWVVDRPGAVQANIQLGMLGPDRNDPRWAALDVASCAIGGSFGSRLNKVLREERGFTYGIHAGFRPNRHLGTFGVHTSSRTEVAADAVAEALQLLDLANDPITQAEAEDARSYLLGIAPLQFQTADTIADQAATLAGAGMPPEWINQHQSAVSQVSAEQASQAFSEVVDSDQLNVVLCGDADQLVPGLARVGLTAEVVEIQP